MEKELKGVLKNLLIKDEYFKGTVIRRKWSTWTRIKDESRKTEKENPDYFIKRVQKIFKRQRDIPNFVKVAFAISDYFSSDVYRFIGEDDLPVEKRDSVTCHVWSLHKMFNIALLQSGIDYRSPENLSPEIREFIMCVRMLIHVHEMGEGLGEITTVLQGSQGRDLERRGEFENRIFKATLGIGLFLGYLKNKDFNALSFEDEFKKCRREIKELKKSIKESVKKLDEENIENEKYKAKKTEIFEDAVKKLENFSGDYLKDKEVKEVEEWKEKLVKKFSEAESKDKTLPGMVARMLDIMDGSKWINENRISGEVDEKKLDKSLFVIKRGTKLFPKLEEKIKEMEEGRFRNLVVKLCESIAFVNAEVLGLHVRRFEREFVVNRGVHGGNYLVEMMSGAIL